jgi:hypothetical protein
MNDLFWLTLLEGLSMITWIHVLGQNMMCSCHPKSDVHRDLNPATSYWMLIGLNIKVIDCGLGTRFIAK